MIKSNVEPDISFSIIHFLYFNKKTIQQAFIYKQA